MTLNETMDDRPNRMMPLGRLGQPDDIADAILFLASQESNSITGHTLAVAGGR
ncbi:MAG: SDR family oxidoreductase [Candidatus Tectomicrobia bacterium]|nr:SDR family oxidoreductase [Candidatus Tectomicrobia bacterium]